MLTSRGEAPGGYLILKEIDPVLYTRDDPPPTDGLPHDVGTQMHGTKLVNSMNRLFAGYAIEKGFIVGSEYLSILVRPAVANTFASSLQSIIPPVRPS